MKQIITLFFAVIAVFSGYSQTYLQDGDSCFYSGDYACAVPNYDNAFKNASGKDKQIAEIKLTRAKWCAEHIKIANQAFAAKNHSTAKDEYQKVLDSNPKDSFAQSQFAKCDKVLDLTKLRKATIDDLKDIWDNKYGVQPQRSQNLINAGIDPIDAQKRINSGGGKPQEKGKQAKNLRVSKSTLYFTSYGQTSQQINVYSVASTYLVPSGYVPLWCTVKIHKGYLTVTASANPNYISRKDWFKVIVDGIEVRINVEQSARITTNSQQSSSSNSQTTHSNAKKCFNCPKTHDIWGVTLGYTQHTIDHYCMDVIQFGLKVEPLFKYGFGLNTGIMFLGYSKNLFDYHVFEYGFADFGINIPLHLEYRLNFSKWFNVFVYGGAGFYYITNYSFSDYSFPTTLDYGCGFRINHIQFNVGSSIYLGDFRINQNFEIKDELFQKLNYSISYMF